MGLFLELFLLSGSAITVITKRYIKNIKNTSINKANIAVNMSAANIPPAEPFIFTNYLENNAQYTLELILETNDP